MMEIELLLDERPRLFKKSVFEDGTIVYTYLPHDRHFGWSIIEKNNKRQVVPAIGKLKYPFEAGFGDDKVYIYPQLTKEAEKIPGGKLLIKYDGYWTMAWEFDGRVVFRTRQKPFIGQKAATAKIIEELNLHERVKKYVKDGYWPMFEIWGPGLKKFGILNGGTRTAELWKELKIDQKAPLTDKEKKLQIIPTVLGAFDIKEKRWLDYTDLLNTFEDLYIAETLKTIGLDDYIPMHPRNVLKTIDYLEKWNLEHGMKRANYYIDDNRIVIEVPKFDNPEAMLEGAVLYAHDKHLYRGFKLKPYTVYVIDTYTKKKPPTWRIRQEVVKAISDEGELYYAKNPYKLTDKVLQYLAEDYEITKDIQKLVEKKTLRILAEIIMKNHPEYLEKHPRDLAKEGWHKSFIGVFVTIRS